jgi:hypothetical protein
LQGEESLSMDNNSKVASMHMYQEPTKSAKATKPSFEPSDDPFSLPPAAAFAPPVPLRSLKLTSSGISARKLGRLKFGSKSASDNPVISSRELCRVLKNATTRARNDLGGPCTARA